MDGDSDSNRDRDRGESLPGADDILPLLILAVKEANPPRLASQLQFLQRYTPSYRLVSESGYLLTQFFSAVHFLETADASSLTIPKGEFEAAMHQAKLQQQQQHHPSEGRVHTTTAMTPTWTGALTARDVYARRHSHSPDINIHKTSTTPFSPSLSQSQSQPLSRSCHSEYQCNNSSNNSGNSNGSALQELKGIRRGNAIGSGVGTATLLGRTMQTMDSR
eukprot:gene4680-9276_t